MSLARCRSVIDVWLVQRLSIHEHRVIANVDRVARDDYDAFQIWFVVARWRRDEHNDIAPLWITEIETEHVAIRIAVHEHHLGVRERRHHAVTIDFEVEDQRSDHDED